MCDDTPKILDFGDMDSQKWLEYARYKPFPLSAGYWLEGKKLEHEEKRLAGAVRHVHRDHSRRVGNSRRVTGIDATSDWFPNGVDSVYFAPTEQSYDPDTISFVGRMDYYPNQECMFDFCTHALPLLRRTRPNVKLSDRRRGPVASGRRLGRLPGVTVTGSVPDVRPYVRTSAANGSAAQYCTRHAKQNP